VSLAERAEPLVDSVVERRAAAAAHGAGAECGHGVVTPLLRGGLVVERFADALPGALVEDVRLVGGPAVAALAFVDAGRHHDPRIWSYDMLSVMLAPSSSAPLG
jgi:hypothetical protein